MNVLNLTIASEMNNIRMVENFIEKIIEEFELPQIQRGKLTLAVIEAVNNSILFGNRQDSRKTIKLVATKGRRKIVVTVEDEGDGFDFRNLPDPTTPDNLMKTTGRGLYLMVTLTDELLFARNGAKVVMTFLLTN